MSSTDKGFETEGNKANDTGESAFRNALKLLNLKTEFSIMSKLFGKVKLSEVQRNGPLNTLTDQKYNMAPFI